MSLKSPILIMAGGTGGHIFPALAVAHALQEKGYPVSWLGTKAGMEAKILARHPDIPIDFIQIQNLRGKGLKRHLRLPFHLFKAILQARKIIQKRQVKLIIGFGGYVSGPGALAAKSLAIPFIIHEQNAIPGLTNRILSRWAAQVLTGFPHVFPQLKKAFHTGNPIRNDLLSLHRKADPAHSPLQLLIIGGSLGAEIFNQIIPEAIALIPESNRPEVWHQCGDKNGEDTTLRYQTQHVSAKVTPFINDMNAAYTWADLIICRAGALTVSELAIIGKPALFVPLPYAADNHQYYNAKAPTDHGASILIPQAEFSAEKIATLLQKYIQNPNILSSMAEKMRELGQPTATELVIEQCMKYLNKKQ
ncbi:MAG: undecaprenyldiphospho-muramoylpentapeptide beta-N-acetylglucosaminyltransferase [Gammaproteobacteria bacterium]|nr:undecaprenyldiphospho-muramoylpentapeptide beta-N-acetylglucosaminyltransferase [Gammaproteobacteria bacterium]